MGITINSGGLNFGLASSGDLTKFLQPGPDLILHLDERVETICGVPDVTLDDVPAGSIATAVKFSKTATWKLPEWAISLTCEPESTGTIRFTKSGTLISYLDGDQKPFATAVPDGHVYVTVELKMNLDIEASASAKAQGFGLKGSLSKDDCFTIANHRCFPAAQKAIDAIRETLSGFTLPFQPSGVLALGDQDLLDFQFLGKLELGLGLTYGFDGAAVCGRSAGEISRALAGNKLAAATLKVNPGVSVAAKFAVTYDHEDAFRFVFKRTKDPGGDAAILTIMRMDKSTLATKLTAGVSATAGVAVDLKPSVLQSVGDAVGSVSQALAAAGGGSLAEKLTAQLAGSGVTAIEGLTDDANKSVNDLLSKVSGKTGIELVHERATTDTVLFELTFDLSGQAQAENAIQLALQGHIAQAAVAPGVRLAPGSLMEHEFRRRTAFTFQFFDLWKWQHADEYVQNVSVVYAGNNTLRWVATTGVTHSSGLVGHGASCDIFFRAEAREAASTGSVEDVSVVLHFELVDKNRNDMLDTVKALKALGADGLGEASTALAACALTKNPCAKTVCVFPASAFCSLKVDEYAGEVPPPLPHLHDARNYEEFAQAVNAVNGRWLGFDSYSKWAVFNRTAVDREESQMIPNRRKKGNIAMVWPHAFTQPSGQADRRFCVYYSDSARAFMNLCDDLRQLHQELDAVATEEAFQKLLKEMDDIVEQVPPSFIKATLVALVRVMGSGVEDIVVKAAGQTASASFQVRGAAAPIAVAAQTT